MRFKHLISLLALAVAACGQEAAEQEQASSDARPDAVVEQAPIPEALDLEAITFLDIERENLFGAGCSFAPTGGGMGALAIAQGEAGYLKIDGEVVRFSPDADSPELPLGARERYTGSAHSFQLTMQQDEAEQSGYETVNYPGRLTVRDRTGAIISYDSEGMVQCGS